MAVAVAASVMLLAIVVEVVDASLPVDAVEIQNGDGGGVPDAAAAAARTKSDEESTGKVGWKQLPFVVVVAVAVLTTSEATVRPRR